MNTDGGNYVSSLPFQEIFPAAANSLASLPYLVIILSSDDFRIVYLNDASCAWLKNAGVDDPIQALGKHPSEAYSGWRELAQAICKDAQCCSEAKLFKGFEIEVAGQVTCWDIVRIPNANAAGETTLITVILFDVTDRKSAEIAVRQSEEQYRELVQGINSVVLRWDQHGAIKFINDFGQRLFGYSADELVGKNVMGTIVSETDKSGHDLRAMIRGLLEHPDRYTANVNQNMRSDGELVWMAWTNKPRFDRNGRLAEILSVGSDITEQKRLEQDLQRYKFFFRHARDIIHFLDKDGRILDANNAAVDAYQYSMQELLSMTIFDLRSPESSPMITERVLQAGENGLLFEAIHLRKDGTTFPVEVSARSMKVDGETLIMNIVRDITQRKEAERILRESEERYRHLFESNPLPMWVYDRESLRFIAVNDAAIRSYGYTKDEFLSMTIKDIRPAEDVSALLGKVAEKRSGLSTSGAWRHKKKDGTIIDVEITTYDLFFAGRDARLVLSNDITEKRRAEEALLEAESKYRSLVEGSSFGVFIIQDACFRYVNQRMAEIYGFTQDEMLRIPITDLVAPEDLELATKILRERLEAEVDGAHYSFKAIRKDGRIIDVEVYGSRTIYQGKPAVIGSLLDITERRLAEQKDRLLEEQKRDFYQRTILAATEGKLLITDNDAIKSIVGPPIATWDIDGGECLGMIRNSVEQIARAKGMDEHRSFDFILCVGEASTNAIKHAKGGTATLHEVQGGLIFVVSDHGPGIEAIALPEVALKRGYTTAISLGMGYKEMISLSDKVYLSTGPEGTTVAVKMGLHAEEVYIPGNVLPETW